VRSVVVAKIGPELALRGICPAVGRRGIPGFRVGEVYRRLRPRADWWWRVGEFGGGKEKSVLHARSELREEGVPGWRPRDRVERQSGGKQGCRRIDVSGGPGRTESILEEEGR
jgi:hypothetical protein